MRIAQRTKVLALALGLAGGVIAGLADASAASKDEGAIKARVAELVARFNDRDAKSMAAFWVEDGSLINPAGLAGKGRTEIEKVILSDLATVLKDTKIAMEVVSVRAIGKDAAWVEIDQAVSGIRTPDGKALPTTTFHVPCLMLKKGNVWMIAEARPYAYLVPTP